MTAQDIAERIGCLLEGDGRLEITSVSSLERAGAGELTFMGAPKYHRLLASTRASVVIVGMADAVEPGAAFAVLRSDNPYLSFAHAARLLARRPHPPIGIHAAAIVDADAEIGPDAAIGPGAVIGVGATIGARAVIYPTVVIGDGARLGDDCVLHAGVSIRDHVVIGHRVTILDGAVIGGDGFGFVRQPDGAHIKIPQQGAVVIEDDVEIGANTTIDRPAVGETRVQAGTKIDNLVHVAHGVTVGRRVLLAAQVGIAGSTVIEDEVMFGGQVGVAGHVRIGKGAMATGRTGITGNLRAGAFVSGYPEAPNLQWKKSQAIVRRLPDLKKRLETLEQRIADLEEQLAACRPPSAL